MTPQRALVAMSLIRPSDTRAARAFQTMVEAGLAIGDPGAWVLQLVDNLGIVGPDRPARVARALSDADTAISRAAQAGIHLVTRLETDYPAALRLLVDPPIVLWCRGAPAALQRPMVALVGSRRASASGLVMADRLARGLAEAGIVVVSGLARGIDAAAHRGALAAGGTTVAVLGCGVDVIYPPEHRALTTDVLAAGSLVSEFPPGTRPFPGHFPLRNRIISGLARVVVVVEASEQSGSLITARMALEQGRSVLAVPGNVASGCYKGCHALIKDGAGLVETVEDVLSEFGWGAGGAPRQDSDHKSRENRGLLAWMRAGELVDLDELACRSGLGVPTLLAELSQAEIAGHVVRKPGQLYLRLD